MISYLQLQFLANTVAQIQYTVCIIDDDELLLWYG